MISCPMATNGTTFRSDSGGFFWSELHRSHVNVSEIEGLTTIEA